MWHTHTHVLPTTHDIATSCHKTQSDNTPTVKDVRGFPGWFSELNLLCKPENLQTALWILSQDKSYTKQYTVALTKAYMGLNGC